jgi:tol-pal system protein YbgF
MRTPFGGRPALPLLLLGLATGCAGLPGIGGPRSPALPDSTAIRARLQEERLQRLEQSSAEQERLLRRMNAEQSAQLETVLAEIRALGERLTTIERRISMPRWEPAPNPARSPEESGSVPVAPGGDTGVVIPPGTTGDPTFGSPPASGTPSVTGAGLGRSGGAELSDPPEEGAQLYQTAYQELMEDNYQLALSDFRAFLERYPRTRLSDNAQYWIGEVYYEQKQFPVAVDEFRKVMDEYPDQDKVPAACYKLALSFRTMRDAATAKRYLDLLITRYPDTREAQLARERRTEF